MALAMANAVAVVTAQALPRFPPITVS